MEQGNNKNNPGGPQPPKMPKFNMNWLYILIIVGLMVAYLSGGTNSLGGSATQEATYTQFKQYVEKGYVLSVVANKTENTLKLYINPKYSREVYKTSAKNLGSNPYVEVQFGSVDEVDRFANAMVQAKKINSFSYKNGRFPQNLVEYLPADSFLRLHLVDVGTYGRHGRFRRRNLQCRQEQSTYV